MTIFDMFTCRGNNSPRLSLSSFLGRLFRQSFIEERPSGVKRAGNWTGREFGPASGREKITAGLFTGFRLRKGPESAGRASMMKRKRILGMLAGFMLVFVLTGPLAAAENSFELTIPGCNY
jgi:hypothetical protein